MRIRFYDAYASNNSGSYTIVGSFRDVASAEEAARLIDEVSAAHDEWRPREWESMDGDSPLDAFAKEHGLRAAIEAKPGREDEWPHYGERPKAVALLNKVVIHAPYTVTVSPVFGEFIYSRGGRVELELDHAHQPLAVEFSFCSPGMSRDPQAESALDAFETRVKDALPAWQSSCAPNDPELPVEPAWHHGAWNVRHLSVIFQDVVEGILGIRALAEDANIALTFRIFECPFDVADPFALLRSRPVPYGAWRVILWRAGPDRIASMKALREATDATLEEARAMIDTLPCEPCVDVSEARAKRAVQLLGAAGCDAEVVIPAARGR